MRNFTFTKADRILNRSEFIELSRSGETIHNKLFILSLRTGRSDRTRLGVTVSKKVGKSATRNRIKRIIREHFRINRHELTGSWDINFIVKKGVAGIPSKEIFSSLQSLYQRIEAR